jgi:hypothetical protein
MIGTGTVKGGIRNIITTCRGTLKLRGDSEDCGIVQAAQAEGVLQRAGVREQNVLRRC